MEQNNQATVTVRVPEWAQSARPDEQKFCEEFLIYYPMVFCEGSFYGIDGWISEEEVRRRIFSLIHQFIRTDIGKKTGKLLEALKYNCGLEKLAVSLSQVHCRNGTYHWTTDRFTTEKKPCRYRLPVNFNRDCGQPEQWLKFLSELLYEEDIWTLQEFIGYCLIPSTHAQKMLLIIGSGGEGKSRIGVVMSALFGQYMSNGSLSKLERSPFARADLQNRLVMVDDDLQLEGLTSTNNIKSIVTADHPMDLERKGIQSYQGQLWCRLMGFGNGNLRSLHDRSHGFFRRQIILTTRPVDPGREDDPFLAERIIDRELEAILMWAIEGLMRMAANNMCISVSPRARENLRFAVAEGNNIPEFLSSTGYLRFDPQGTITSRQLYQLYRDWCQDNEMMSLHSRTFSAWMLNHYTSLGLSYSNRIPGGNGRLVRGYQGLRSVI